MEVRVFMGVLLNSRRPSVFQLAALTAFTALQVQCDTGSGKHAWRERVIVGRRMCVWGCCGRQRLRLLERGCGPSLSCLQIEEGNTHNKLYMQTGKIRVGKHWCPLSVTEKKQRQKVTIWLLSLFECCRLHCWRSLGLLICIAHNYGVM